MMCGTDAAANRAWAADLILLYRRREHGRHQMLFAATMRANITVIHYRLANLEIGHMISRHITADIRLDFTLAADEKSDTLD